MGYEEKFLACNFAPEEENSLSAPGHTIEFCVIYTPRSSAVRVRVGFYYRNRIGSMCNNAMLTMS